MILDDATEMLESAAEEMRPNDDVEVWLAGCSSGSTQSADQKALTDLVAAIFGGITPECRWGQEALVLILTPRPAGG